MQRYIWPTNSSNSDNLEWPSRSFNYCIPLQMCFRTAVQHIKWYNEVWSFCDNWCFVYFGPNHLWNSWSILVKFCILWRLSRVLELEWESTPKCAWLGEKTKVTHFTARRYTIAVYTVFVCMSVRPSVCHKPALYQTTKCWITHTTP